MAIQDVVIPNNSRISNKKTQESKNKVVETFISKDEQESKNQTTDKLKGDK